MTNRKPAYAAPCPRCESTGRHQGGKCFQCHGRAFIALKSSKLMKTYQHGLTIDGKRHTLVTWGKDQAEAIQVAKNWMTHNGYTF